MISSTATAASSDRAPYRKLIRKPKEIHYPSSDGKPLAETETHVTAILANLARLQWHFRNHADIYVAANNFIYYEEGNNKARFSPDGYVVFGVAKRVRDSYFLWKEGQPPAVVFEFTSPKTKKKDRTEKKELYQRLKINEYFLCDPKDEYLHPPVQGYRLVRGVYQPITPSLDGAVHSVELHAKLKLEGTLLAMYDDISGARILNEAEYQTQQALDADRNAREADRKALDADRKAREADRKALDADRKAREAEAKRQDAEAENARLREELARLQKQKS